MFVVIFIWVRGSLPRYRYDQLMRLGWKILLPISLGFVILYAGVYYDKVYTIFYEFYYPIEKLYKTDEKFDNSWLNYYNVLYNRIGLWHEFNFLELKFYGWNWTQYGRPNVLKTLNNDIFKIFEEWKTLKEGTYYFYKTKTNKIFFMEQYEGLPEITQIQKRYHVNLILRERGVGYITETLPISENLESDINWEKVNNFDYYEIKKLEKVIQNINWEELEKEVNSIEFEKK